jgi:hypothetical protein
MPYIIFSTFIDMFNYHKRLFFLHVNFYAHMTIFLFLNNVMIINLYFVCFLCNFLLMRFFSLFPFLLRSGGGEKKK